MKRSFFFITLLAAVVLSVACYAKTEGPAGARSFTDEIGRAITVKPAVRRIVSLAPSVTETLFALGLGDRIVGVTSYCDYPPEAREKQKVGDTQRPSIERIVALKPDLVIASTASQLEQFVRKLDELGIPIYVSNPRDLDELLQSINRIGEIVNAPDRARELTTRLRERIQAVESHTDPAARPRVLLVVGTNPLITIGKNSFINDLIRRAGGQSITGDEPREYPQYSLETAVAKQPEIIFLQSGESKLPERLEQTPAARAGRVHKLDDDLLLRPGPRIVEGLEQMAQKISFK